MPWHLTCRAMQRWVLPQLLATWTSPRRIARRRHCWSDSRNEMAVLGMMGTECRCKLLQLIPCQRNESLPIKIPLKSRSCSFPTLRSADGVVRRGQCPPGIRSALQENPQRQCQKWEQCKSDSPWSRSMSGQGRTKLPYSYTEIANLSRL